MNKTYKKYMFLFILPVLFFFVATFVLPFIFGIFLSFFTNWSINIFNFGQMKFCGLNNFVLAFREPSFQRSFLYTCLFCVVSLVTINVFSFIIAMLLTRGRKFTNVFRTIFFMPNLIGGIILGLIWQIIINGVLYNFFPEQGIYVTSNEWYGFFGLVVLMNWQLIGYMTIIYISGIQNINNDLIEASSIDGANFFQKLIHVIIPSVMPAITICLFLTITNTFKLYDQNYALTRGAPTNILYGDMSGLVAFDIISTFNRSTNKGINYPIAQAKAVIFFVVIGMLSALQVLLTRRKEVEA